MIRFPRDPPFFSFKSPYSHVVDCAQEFCGRADSTTNTRLKPMWRRLQIPADPHRCFRVFIMTNCVPVSSLLIHQPSFADQQLPYPTVRTTVAPFHVVKGPSRGYAVLPCTRGIALQVRARQDPGPSSFFLSRF